VTKEIPNRADLVTPANLLTFSRLLLLPVVMAGIVTHHGYLTVAAMTVLWTTDLLDGRLARWLGQAGAFGKTLDSTVDFVLIYSLFITFYAAGRLASYQFAVLYLAMLTILALQFAQMAGGSGGAASTALGKATGALEYGYLLFLVAREVMRPSPGLATTNTVFFAVLALAIVLNSALCIVSVSRSARALRNG
jgi:phosphatidylglycerophosphate synthase